MIGAGGALSASCKCETRRPRPRTQPRSARTSPEDDLAVGYSDLGSVASPAAFLLRAAFSFRSALMSARLVSGRALAKSLLYRSRALGAWHACRNANALTVVMFHRVLPDG